MKFRVHVSFIIGFILGMLLMRFQVDSTPKDFEIVLESSISDDYSRQCFNVQEVNADVLIQKHIKDFSNNILCMRYRFVDERLYPNDRLKGEAIWDKDTLFIKELVITRVNGIYRVIKAEPQ